MSALCVDPAQVAKIWPLASPLIERAYASGIGDDTFEQVERDILNGDALLWVVVREKEIIAAAATKIKAFAAKNVCTVLAVSGSDMKEWIGHLATIEQYARNENCAAVRLYGRRGWARIFTDYEEPWVALEKRL